MIHTGTSDLKGDCSPNEIANDIANLVTNALNEIQLKNVFI